MSQPNDPGQAPDQAPPADTHWQPPGPAPAPEQPWGSAPPPGQPPAYPGPQQPPPNPGGAPGGPRPGAQGGVPYLQQGQPSPYGGPPVPYPPMAPQRTDYASWGKRVGAFLIDNIPSYLMLIVLLVGYVSLIVSLLTQVAQTGEDPAPDIPAITAWGITVGVLWIASLVWAIINRWIRGGRTGQSLGKRVTKIKLISEQTGQPIGAGNAFLRDIVHYVDGLAYIGYLWPLWDEKRQTFADKLMRTIVVDQPDDPGAGSYPSR